MEKHWGNKPVEEIAEGERRQMDDVTGFRILQRRQVSDDQIALTIYAEGRGHSAEMLFQRFGNDWKWAGKTGRRGTPGQ